MIFGDTFCRANLFKGDMTYPNFHGFVSYIIAPVDRYLKWRYLEMTIECLKHHNSWLVVDLPLWKIWGKSVGMWTFPIYGKINQMFQTTNQQCSGFHMRHTPESSWFHGNFKAAWKSHKTSRIASPSFAMLQLQFGAPYLVKLVNDCSSLTMIHGRYINDNIYIYICS